MTTFIYYVMELMAHSNQHKARKAKMVRIQFSPFKLRITHARQWSPLEASRERGRRNVQWGNNVEQARN